MSRWPLPPRLAKPLPFTEFDTREKALVFHEELQRQIRELPGVVAVGAVEQLPLEGFTSCTVVFREHQPFAADEKTPCVSAAIAAPGFFESLRIPVRERIPDWNRSRVLLGDRPASHCAGREHERSDLCCPHQPASHSGTLQAYRCDCRINESARPGGECARDDSGGRTIDVTHLIHHGVAWCSVVRRARAECRWHVRRHLIRRRAASRGNRPATGAGCVARLVVVQSMRLAVAGVALGVLGSLAVGRLLSSLLFEVRPSDPVVLVSVSLLLLAIAAAASFVPARRAANINPIVAMRAG